MRRDIMCIGGTSQFPTTILRGIDQWGERFGYPVIDPLGGAIGAFAQGDGINTGGQSRTPLCKIANVEHTEQTFPLLYLYRKELPDSGGAGKYRGGQSAESCFIPHNTPSITYDAVSSGNAIPTSTGMMGGYPATTNYYKFVRDTDIAERFAASRMIEDCDELAGEQVTLPLRQMNVSQGPGDVYAVAWSAAGGFGDPMDRDPEAVAKDFANLAVTLAAARDIYGVVLDKATGAVDAAATEKLRGDARVERVRRHSKPARKLSGAVLIHATVALDIREGAGGAPHHCCAKCASDLGGTAENYKEHCIREDHPISSSNPLIGDPGRFIDDIPVFRQFFCPGCGTLIENEVALTQEPLLTDISIDARPALRAAAE